jgi:carbonic anhydrase/acetyltransferase-like protein (isoleucine patch superfamily)
MKKIILLIVLFLGAKSFSQTNGITYQAVILNPSGEQLPGVNNTTSPMVNKNICLQFQFIDEFSKLEYQETIQTKTDVFGMVNLVIGSGNQTAGYAVSFKTIEWKALKKSMIVSINTSGSCSAFIQISNQPFTAVPFAFSAINAGNVTGVVAIENGGTNAITVIGSKTNLSLEKVNNTSDLDKPMSIAAQAGLNLNISAISVNATAISLNTAKVGITTQQASAITANSAKVGYTDSLVSANTDVAANTAKTGITAQQASDITANNSKTGITSQQSSDITTNNAKVGITAQQASDITANNAKTGITSQQSSDITTSNAKVGITAQQASDITANNAKTGITSQQSSDITTNNAKVGITTTQANEIAANTLKAGITAQQANDITANNSKAGITTQQASYITTNNAKIGITTQQAADIVSNNAKVGFTDALVANKANLTSPDFSGIPTAPTAASGTNTTQLATTAFVTEATTGKFVDVTTNQTIAGTKTYSSDIVVNGIKVGNGGGNQSTIIGDSANGTLDNNTALGFMTLDGNSGTDNTAVGTNSMKNSQATSYNTAIGENSGTGVTSGNGNTFLGHNANVTNNSAISNATAIGADAIVTASNTIQLGADGMNGTIPISNVKTSGTITVGTITYPNTDGSQGQFLATDGAGALAWSTPASFSIASINGNSDANGAIINNGALSLTPADATNGGIVTTGTQTFSGNKEIIGNLKLSGIIGSETLDQSSSSQIGGTGAYNSLWQSFTAGISGSLSKVTMLFYNTLASGTLYIYQGTGTNGTLLTSQPFSVSTNGANELLENFSLVNPPNVISGSIYTMAFIASSGTVWGGTTNDYNRGVSYYGNTPSSNSNSSKNLNFKIFVRQSSGSVSLAVGEVTYPSTHGTTGQVLTTNGSGSLTWSSPSAGVSNTIGAISSSSNANGATITTGVLNLAPADATNGGIVTTADQTFSGNKTFVSDIIVKGLKIGNGGGSQSTVVGDSANASQANNTALGFMTLDGNSGTDNTAVGTNSMKNSGATSRNTSIGENSGASVNTGNENTYLGYNANVTNNSTISNATAIGAGALVTSSNTIQLGNTAITNVNTSSFYTGSGFKTPLGNSLQFLKADGSVDSSTYLTSAGTATNVSGVVAIANGGTGLSAVGTNGQVLTSDANGLASWASPSSGTPAEYAYAYIGNASKLGAQTLTATFPAATYVNGVVMNGSSITLHAGKMYEVSVFFYIYNATGGHTYKMKDATNSAYLGTEIYFGQGGSDISYNKSGDVFLIKPTTDIYLELEKTQGTDVNLIGKIVVREIK